MSDHVPNIPSSQRPPSADPAWLVNAEPEEALAMLDTASQPGGALAAAVYRASMRLHSKYLPAVRRDLLALDAVRFGDRQLADALASVPIEGPESLWRVAWSTGSQVDSRLRFVSDEFGTPEKLAVIVRDGRPLVVTDWDDETESASDPSFELDGRTFGVDYDDATAWVFDTATGERRGEAFAAPFGTIDFVTTAVVGDERWVMAGGGDSMVGFACAWAVNPPVAIGNPILGHTTAIRAVATTVVNGRPVVTSTGWDGSVRLWDLHTGAPIGPPVAEHKDAVTSAPMAVPDIGSVFDDGDWTWSVATAEIEGRSLTASGHNDGIVLLRHTTDNALIREFTTDDDGRDVFAVAFGEVDGHALLIAGAGRTIRLWDPLTGEPVGEPMEDDTGEALRSLAFIELDGQPCVLAGTASSTYRVDGSLSVWDLKTCARYGEPMMFPEAVSCVSVASENSVAVGYGNEVAVLRRR